MSPPGEESAMAPSIARRKWKSVVSALEGLEAAHDQYQYALTDEVSCIASEAWFLDVNTMYIQGITDARNWLKLLGHWLIMTRKTMIILAL